MGAYSPYISAGLAALYALANVVRMFTPSYTVAGKICDKILAFGPDLHKAGLLSGPEQK